MTSELPSPACWPCPRAAPARKEWRCFRVSAQLLAINLVAHYACFFVAQMVILMVDPTWAVAVIPNNRQVRLPQWRQNIAAMPGTYHLAGRDVTATAELLRLNEELNPRSDLSTPPTLQSLTCLRTTALTTSTVAYGQTQSSDTCKPTATHPACQSRQAAHTA